MVELAIGVAAFLFLCWVAIQGFVIVAAICGAIWEDKGMRYGVLAIIPFALLWLALTIWG